MGKVCTNSFSLLMYILSLKSCHNLELLQHQLPKVPVFKCQKMALRAPKSKKGLQKPRETPPKWFIRHLVHAFSIFGRVSSQFLKIMFLEAFWNCFTLLKGQKLETARRMPQKSFFLQKWVAYIQDQIILKGKVILTTF